MSLQEWENLASLLSLAVAVVVMASFWLIQRRWNFAACKLCEGWASRRKIGFVLVPVFSLAVNVGIAMHRGIPMPLVHDEFSYLLAADTFAHGRLTNPTPPFFEHFETPQELMRPTRMSKYPPGQGIVLMLGQLLFGKPIVGVWLSTAAACLAIYWMLLEFIPISWALAGAIFAAANPRVLEWSQIYWGGSVALLGGALVVGAWGRLMMRASTSASVLLGIGLVILANSRPYEGLVLSIPLLISLGVHARGRLLPIVLPSVALLAMAGVWMGFYNFRVTGHVLRMPFMEYAAQYDVYPKFWFMPRKPAPVFRNPSLQWVHQNFEQGRYETLRTLEGFAAIARIRAAELISENLVLAAMLIPFAASFALLKDRRVRWLMATLGIFLLGLWAENFVYPHYTAPATPIILLLAFLGAGKLMQWKWRARESGHGIVVGVAIGTIAGVAMCLASPRHLFPELVRQQQIVQREAPLHAGRHLVFVTYAPLHQYYVEYVYNPADLENSRIIWARSFGPEADLPVARYFSNRQVWVLDADQLTLKPYLTGFNAETRRHEE